MVLALAATDKTGCIDYWRLRNLAQKNFCQMRRSDDCRNLAQENVCQIRVSCTKLKQRTVLPLKEIVLVIQAVPDMLRTCTCKLCG